MQLPTMLLTLLGSGLLAVPAHAHTDDTAVEDPARSSDIAGELLAAMSRGGPGELRWDYHFQPLPPCSLG